MVRDDLFYLVTSRVRKKTETTFILHRLSCNGGRGGVMEVEPGYLVAYENNANSKHHVALFEQHRMPVSPVTSGRCTCAETHRVPWNSANMYPETAPAGYFGTTFTEFLEQHSLCSWHVKL